MDFMKNVYPTMEYRLEAHKMMLYQLLVLRHLPCKASISAKSDSHLSAPKANFQMLPHKDRISMHGR